MLNKRKSLIVMGLSGLIIFGGQKVQAAEFMSETTASVLESYYKENTNKFYVNDIEVERNLITRNFSKRQTDPKFIVIHDTDNRDSGADVYMHGKYYQTNKRGASAHYTVQDDAIVQSVDDRDSAWHSQDRYNPKINNSNSIGIEMTVHPESDYKTMMNNTVELTKHLMDKYNISPENVVRHKDVSGKTCPRTMAENPSLWVKFKRAIGDTSIIEDEATTKDTVTSANERVITDITDLHDEASWIYERLAKIEAGSRVEFIEEVGTWVKVKYQDKVGFVPAIFIETVNQFEKVKVNQLSVLTKNQSLGGESLSVITTGTEVELYSKDDTWARVKYDGQFGYIPVAYIAK